MLNNKNYNEDSQVSIKTLGSVIPHRPPTTATYHIPNLTLVEKRINKGIKYYIPPTTFSIKVLHTKSNSTLQIQSWYYILKKYTTYHSGTKSTTYYIP
jgi:hypothetical protein